MLGTGKMGTALVRAFAAAGHGVVAWNRSLARAEPLRSVARLASTPATAARDASLIVASLTDYGACSQVLFTAEMGELLRGKTVVQLTSGTPSNARTGAAWAAQHGVSCSGRSGLKRIGFAQAFMAKVKHRSARKPSVNPSSRSTAVLTTRRCDDERRGTRF